MNTLTDEEVALLQAAAVIYTGSLIRPFDQLSHPEPHYWETPETAVKEDTRMSRRLRKGRMLQGLYGDIAKPKSPRGGGPEKDIQKACLDWLNTVPGVRMWRQNRGAKLNIYRRKDGTEGRSFVKFGEPGATDTTGVGPHGVRIEIEIKRPGSAPDLEQLSYMGMVRDGGGISFWCDSLRSCVDQLRFEFKRRGWDWSERWEVS